MDDNIDELTPGMAANRRPGRYKNSNRQCPKCGRRHPKYPGRYPKCLDYSTEIRLLDGTSKAIGELSESSDEFFVYSYDLKSSRIAIAKATAIKTIKEKMIKITLDNNESVICTEDHLFLSRDGNYVEARHLSSGFSIMPLYNKYTDNTYKIQGYEMIYQPEQKEWYFTHYLADEYNSKNNLCEDWDGSYVRHHKDFNKLNNNPSNIERMSWIGHRDLHANSPICKKMIEMSKNGEAGWGLQWKDPNFRAKMSELGYDAIFKNIHNNHEVSEIRKERAAEGISNKFKTDSRFAETISRLATEHCNKININPTEAMKEQRLNFIEKGLEYVRSKEGRKSISDKAISTANKIVDSICEYCGKTGFGKHASFAAHVGHCKRKSLSSNNHKVISIEKIGERQGYDLQVPEYNNFALDVGIFVHNSCPNCGAELCPLEPNHNHLVGEDKMNKSQELLGVCEVKMKDYYHVEEYAKGNFYVEDAEGGDETGPFDNKEDAQKEADKRNREYNK